MAGKQGYEGTRARRPVWRGRQDRDYNADDDDRDQVQRKHRQYRVTCVDQVETETGHHRIVRLGVEEGGRVRQLDVGEVFRMIGRGDRFYVLRGDHKAYLVRNPGPHGEPHVESIADDTKADNLRSLPACAPEPVRILRVWPLLVGLGVLLVGLWWLGSYAARITWPPLASIVYGTPLGDPQLNAVANVSGRFVYTPVGATVLDAGLRQSLTAIFTPQPWLLGGVGPIELALLLALIILAIILGRTRAWRRITRYQALRWGSLALVVLLGVFFILRGASAQNRLDVTPAPITLQFGPLADRVYGDLDFPVSATITPQIAGIGTTFAATAGPCSMIGAATIHITGAGDCTVTATASSTSANYGPSVNQAAKFNIAKGPNQLDFPQPPDRKLDDGDFTVSATASSKLPVNFMSGDTSICTVINPNTVHPLSAKDCPITAQQNGSELYQAATPVTRVVKVTQAQPPIKITIDWNDPADIFYPSPLGPTQLNARWTPPDAKAVYAPVQGAVLQVGMHQPLTVTVTATANGQTATETKIVHVNVLPQGLGIKWDNPADIVYPTPLGPTQLNATSSPAGTPAYTPGSTTILPVGNHQPLTVTFTSKVADQTITGSKTVYINVLPPGLAVKWDNPADIYYPTPLGPAQLNATSEPAGTPKYDKGTGTVLPVGNHQPLNVTFTAQVKDVTLTGTKTVFINVLAPVTIIENGEFLKNGGFEEGFTTSAPATTVGTHWTPFNNGGERVEFGYYDDTWAPVVSEGRHAQEIEIGTDIPPFRWPDSTPNRYSGIYQTVTGLIPGRTYTLTLHGRIRTLENDPNTDNWSYIAEWAIDPTGGTNPAALKPAEWHLIADWQHVSFYKTGGGLLPFTTRITAQAGTATLFVRLFKKPGSGYSELNLDLDGLSLYGPKYVVVKP